MAIDWSLVITIALIFFATMAGAWLRSRRRDPCLTSFAGYHVTLEMENDHLVWGVLEVSPTGMELHYRDAVQDEQHVEVSYVLYGQEYSKIQVIFRYADELDEQNRASREKAIRNAFHPGPLRFLGRKLRNLFSTATEAFNEVIGMVIGRARKPVGRFISDTGESYLKRLSSSVIGHVGMPYDPLLERFIGQRVVIELAENGEVHEHVGIFKNYSPDFLEVLDVQYPTCQWMDVGPDGSKGVNCVKATLQNGAIHLENTCNQPVLVVSMTNGEDEDLLNIVLDGGSSIDLYPQKPCESTVMNLRIIRELDLIVPRTRCVIRHRAENYSVSSLTDMIFDVGVLLRPGNRERMHVERLRKRLEENPRDVLAAASLGELMLKNQNLDEAERWLRLAHSMQHSLPDSGRRVQMQIRELERRRQGGMRLPGPGNGFEIAQLPPDTVDDAAEARSWLNHRFF